jgi:hypothetical protein
MDFLAAAIKDSTSKEIPCVKEGKQTELSEMPLINKSSETTVKEGLSGYEKTIVKLEQLDWSFETIRHIETMQEYKVYKEADLEQKQVGEKIGLTRNDIDFDQKDEFGRTNAERIEAHLSPINEEGETIELHHIGQKSDSPFAELTRIEHRGQGNDTILHDKNITTEIDRVEFHKEKNDYWKARMEMED